VATKAAPHILPTPDEYEVAERDLQRLHDVGGSVYSVADKVFKAINTGDEQTVSHADTGALCEFAYWLKHHGEEFLSLAEKLEKVAVLELPTIRHEGSQKDIPIFNEYGYEFDTAEIRKKLAGIADDA
jgi:hypothetical protein